MGKSKRVLVGLVTVVIAVAGAGWGCGSGPAGLSQVELDARCWAEPLRWAGEPGTTLVGKKSGSGVEWISVGDGCVGAWDRAGFTER